MVPASRNTAKNAAYTKELGNPKPGELWLLVTSARRVACNAAASGAVGFPVEAYGSAGAQGMRRGSGGACDIRRRLGTL